MEMIFHLLICIFMFLFVAMIVVFNVARVVYWIKCIRIKDCSKRSCRFKTFCYKYYESYSKEEIARLQKFLEESNLSDEVVSKEERDRRHKEKYKR